jgi:hypothetical protein
LDVIALVLFALTAAAVVVVLVRPTNRALWRDLRWYDLLVYAGMVAGAVVVSLLWFDAIRNHAWRPHEEALRYAMDGGRPPEGWNPLEVQPLVRLIYEFVGDHVSRSMTAFVATALALGVGGVALAGVAGQLLTHRRWVGYAVAALLVFNPTLAYWRTNAFHVALPQVVFAATILGAVLVARKPDRINCAAWFLLGAMCLYLRQEQAGAVVATAAIPLLCGEPGLWKRVGVWLPGLLVAAVLLGVPTWVNLQLAADREDYRTGVRFLPFFLSNRELWEPMSRVGLGSLIGLGLWASAPRNGVDVELRRVARALLVVAVVGTLPAVLFISFGQRHLLASGTAATLLGLTGAAALVSHPRLVRWRAPAIVLVVGLCAVGAVDGMVRMEDWSFRYARTTFTRTPELPGTAVPSGPPVFDEDGCATYTSSWKACEQWFHCHPPKDLTDPALVRHRWDERDGCVVWAIDETDGEVAGARHEWWTVVSRMYSWEPLGRLSFEVDHQEIDLHLYRMAERP